MKIAVTGSSGKLGTEILKHLIKELSADRVVAIARATNKVNFPGIEVREGDYDEKRHFDRALRDIDALLLVSGMDAPDRRIGQHRNVINAAREAGVRKIVYTSIIGETSGTSFSPIVSSNRQTEEDIRTSGIEWVIGRNGLYIEPDIDYIETYKKEGKISNCAGDSKCSYTTRSELGYAYAKLLTENKHKGKTYNLTGEPITQQQLTGFINETFGLNLVYEPVSTEEFRQERTEVHGEFLGSIISGIYASINNGSFNVPSDYKKAAGRNHIAWNDFFDNLINKAT